MASILLLLLLERWWVGAGFRSTDSEEIFFRSKDSEENLQILLWHCKTRDSHAPAFPVLIPGSAQLSTQIITGSKRDILDIIQGLFLNMIFHLVSPFNLFHSSFYSYFCSSYLFLFIDYAPVPIFALVSGFCFQSCFFNKIWLLKEIAGVHFAFQLLEIPSSQSTYEGTKPEVKAHCVQ